MKSDSCPGCAEFLKSFDGDDVKQALRDGTGTDKFEVIDLDHDSLAVDVVASLGDYELPMIATIKEENGKSTVCRLNDDLKPGKCAELKKLPEA